MGRGGGLSFPAATRGDRVRYVKWIGSLVKKPKAHGYRSPLRCFVFSFSPGFLATDLKTPKRSPWSLFCRVKVGNWLAVLPLHRGDFDGEIIGASRKTE